MKILNLSGGQVHPAQFGHALHVQDYMLLSLHPFYS